MNIPTLILAANLLRPQIEVSLETQQQAEVQRRATEQERARLEQEHLYREQEEAQRRLYEQQLRVEQERKERRRRIGNAIGDAFNPPVRVRIERE